MKNRSKALLLSLCAVMLVLATVFGTMAYLTDSDTVTNTFAVGNVQLKLDEAKTDTDGSLVANADRVSGNSYHLLPGHTYNKDPMVTVLKGSEKSYIKMTVTVNMAKELDKVFKELYALKEAKDGGFTRDTALEKIFAGYDKNNWTYKCCTDDTEKNTRTYEFWYKDTVDAKNADVELDALFDQIVVPGWITGEQLATLYETEQLKDGTEKLVDQLTITVNAYAMQADGFTTAEAAWAAFK